MGGIIIVQGYVIKKKVGNYLFTYFHTTFQIILTFYRKIQVMDILLVLSI